MQLTIWAGIKSRREEAGSPVGYAVRTFNASIQWYAQRTLQGDLLPLAGVNTCPNR